MQVRRNKNGQRLTLPKTTPTLFRKLVRNPDIIDGNYNIHWLEKFLAAGGMRD